MNAVFYKQIRIFIVLVFCIPDGTMLLSKSTLNPTSITKIFNHKGQLSNKVVLLFAQGEPVCLEEPSCEGLQEFLGEKDEQEREGFLTKTFFMPNASLRLAKKQGEQR